MVVTALRTHPSTGIYVINLGDTYRKLRMAARVLSAIENPQVTHPPHESPCSAAGSPCCRAAWATLLPTRAGAPLFKPTCRDELQHTFETLLC